MKTGLSKNTFFYTKQKSIKFYVKPCCIFSIRQNNIDEVCRKGRRMPRDYIIINDGVDIRNSLEDSQKEVIIKKINQLTQNSFDYCLENNVIYLSGKHIVNDYCERDPEVLRARGWPVEEDELLEEVINTLCNISEVEKAKLKFDLNGESQKRLSYTVTGKHNGYIGTVAITLQDGENSGGLTESILTVTVLERRVIM